MDSNLKHSTLHALLDITNSTLNSTEINLYKKLVFLYLAKVLNTVIHSI